ncbi:hypothetical protein CCR75_002711 [Bremia lactucae]|uniref:Myb-like DNA-binding protein n=1 Tax=Bremia lactucae TaxID=4779 RepID=A0A976FRS4_BRELC|nr:hypothetical protein CCR75_002711 [Bremia lactucae]
MAITVNVINQLFKHYIKASNGSELIRLPLKGISSPLSLLGEVKASLPNTCGRAWTMEEHARFLEGLELFPSGPWKEIAAHVGTRSTRQTMTHAQKYREKNARRKCGLRSSITESRSRKRQREHESSVEAASPSSVVKKQNSIPSIVSARKGIDPMDFHKCFVPWPLGQNYVYQMVSIPQTEYSNVAVGSSISDPRFLSEEEVKYILEAASVLSPVAHGRIG